MKSNILLMLTIAGTLAACSSTPTSVVDLKHIGEEEVIQTYGKDDSLKQAQPFLVESGMVVSTGFVSMNSDGNRPEAAIKMAQIHARAELAKSISVKIENFAQLADEGTSAESVQLRSIATETAKLTANELRPGKVYYEKVRVVSDSGVPRSEIRAWAQVEIPENSFRRHVMDAIRGQAGKTSFSKEFAATVDSNWKKILGSDQAKDATAKVEAPAEHKPASVTPQATEEE